MLKGSLGASEKNCTKKSQMVKEMLHFVHWFLDWILTKKTKNLTIWKGTQFIFHVFLDQFLSLQFLKHFHSQSYLIHAPLPATLPPHAVRWCGPWANVWRSRSFLSPRRCKRNILNYVCHAVFSMARKWLGCSDK